MGCLTKLPTHRLVRGVMLGAVLAVAGSSECWADNLAQQLEQLEHASKVQHFWREKRAYPYRDKAQRYIAAGEYAKALAVYDAYLKADPGNLKMAWARLELLGSMGSPEQIVAAADAFLQEAPNFIPVLLRRGYALFNQGDREGAKADFQKILKSDEVAPEVRQNIQITLGNLYIAEGRYDQAQDLLELLARQQPDSGPVHERLAGVLYQKGDFHGAERHWRLAMAQDNDPVLQRKIIIHRATNFLEHRQYQACLDLLATREVATFFAQAPVPERLRFYLLLAHGQGHTNPHEAELPLERYLAILEQRPAVLPPDQLQECYRRVADAAFDFHCYSVARRAYAYLVRQGGQRRLAMQAVRSAWYSHQYDQTLSLVREVRTEALNPAEQREMDLLTCSAFEKSNQSEQALSCLERAMMHYPDTPAITAKAAQLAHEHQLFELELDYLTRYFLQQPSATQALNLGYLTQRRGRQHQANQWYGEAYRRHPSLANGMTWARGLGAAHEDALLVPLVRELCGHYSPKATEAEVLHVLLAQAQTRQKRYREAAVSWQNALVYRRTLSSVVGAMDSLYKIGQYRQALRVAENHPPGKASEELSYLDAKAAIYLELEQYRPALQVAREAARRQPDPQRWMAVSLPAFALGHYQLAARSAREVLALDPTNNTARKQLMYCYMAMGDEEAAAAELEQLQQAFPGEYGLSQTLADISVRRYRNDEAIAAYGRALDLADEANAIAAHDVHRLQDIKHMQNMMAELAHPFRYSAGMGLYLDSGDGDQPSWETGHGSISQAYGMVEVAYRPPAWGYRDRRITEWYGRLLWVDEGSVRGDDDSPLQASIGGRIKPLAAYNLVLSTDAVFSLHDPGESDLLLRLSHSHSRAPWTTYHPQLEEPEDMTYLESYAEAGTSLTGAMDYSLYGRLAYGRSYRLASDRYLSPFLYGQLSSYGDDSDTDTDSEVGLGLAVHVFSGLDSHNGYRRSAELTLRIGVDCFAADDEDSVRGLVGLRLMGF